MSGEDFTRSFGLESSRLSRSQVVLDPETTAAVAGDAIIGRSLGMQHVYMAIGRAAVSPLGDSGLRELVCRFLATYTGDSAHEAFLEQTEKLLIAEALRRAGGNQTHAARLLGLPRPTLHAKIQKHKLHGDADRQVR